MGNVFKRVGGLRPGKSVFDLSYEKKFTCDLGQLIPVMLDEVVPGDYWTIGNNALVRCQPLVAPVLHEINLYTHYFFVPYRILWEYWEDFITGGENGDFSDPIPEWEPTNTTNGSLWDFCGLPVGVDPDGAYPIDFIRRAYNRVFNEFYRDQNLQTEVAETNESILVRNWEKDYFTSALPFQQRGTAPALPISGLVPIKGIGAGTQAYNQDNINVYETDATATRKYSSGSYLNADAINWYVEEDPAHLGYPNIRADVSEAVTFDIADLRLAFQIQKWLERNARAGARYTEFLGAHFGVSPRDERLQRPEYIGGSKTPIIISEVLQTSSTDVTSPQGNLAGHGLTASNAYCGKYHAKEFGLIIGIMSIMPRTSYSQGINRQWLRKTKYDFYFPEFANLSEQEIMQAEIFASNVDADNIELFGYAGRYDEMRTKQSQICSQMRDVFNYWHLGREFDPMTPPELNEDFIQCIPRKDIFAAPSEPGLLVSFGNVIKAIRPIPIMSEPGLVDHN